MNSLRRMVGSRLTLAVGASVALVVIPMAAAAADSRPQAALERALSQDCPEYAAAAQTASTGWSCWMPGPGSQTSKGIAPTDPAAEQSDAAPAGPEADPNEPAATPGAARQGGGAGGSEVRAAAPAQSPFLWTFGKTAAYGIGRRVLGSVLVEAQTSLNGRQSRNKMSLTRFAGPAIRQDLYMDCRFESNGRNCGTRAHRKAPTYDNETFTLTKNYLHLLGRQYYIDFNFYFGSLGNRNPTANNGFFHLPPLHSADFTCRTTDRLCRFEDD